MAGQPHKTHQKSSQNHQPIFLNNFCSPLSWLLDKGNSHQPRAGVTQVYQVIFRAAFEDNMFCIWAKYCQGQLVFPSLSLIIALILIEQFQAFLESNLQQVIPKQLTFLLSLIMKTDVFFLQIVSGTNINQSINEIQCVIEFEEFNSAFM